MQREATWVPAAHQTGAAGPKQDLILIVEDNGTNALILCAMLRKTGYRTIVATDGAEGVEMAQRLSPCLVLMDLHMPRLNGFDAAAEIRRRFGDRAPAILAVTANANPEVHAACLASGFRAVISKPIMLDELIGIVGDFLPLSMDAAARSAESRSPSRKS